jgi:hypothetical protein
MGHEWCGKWMPRKKTTCARTPGHGGLCKTAETMKRNRLPWLAPTWTALPSSSSLPPNLQPGKALRRYCQRPSCLDQSGGIGGAIRPGALSPARNSPIARGDRRSSRRSDAPKPGKSTANKRACSASDAHIGANAYTLSGHGLVRTTVGFCMPPLSANRIRTPSIVRKRTGGIVIVGLHPILELRSVLRAREHPGQVPGHPNRRRC